MADNKTIKDGGGTDFTAAFDDISSVFYPRHKLVWGADGAVNDASAAAPLPVVQTGTHNIGTVTTVTTVSAVTAISNALPAGTNAIGKLAANSGVDIGDVDVTSISAGENHLGEVGGRTAVRSITFSTDTSAYASGDLIADTQQMDGFFRVTNGTGVIQTVNIIDEDAQGVALYIILMRTSTSLGTENSAPNISDANLTAGFQGIIAVSASDYVTVSGAKVATIRGAWPVAAVSGTDDLYVAVLNATGTPTFTASGLEMNFGVLLD